MPRQPKSILTRNTTGIIDAGRIHHMHFPKAEIQDEKPSENLSGRLAYMHRVRAAHVNCAFAARRYAVRNHTIQS